MSPEQIFSLLMLIVAVLAVASVLASLVVMSAHRGSGRWCGTDAKGTV